MIHTSPRMEQFYYTGNNKWIEKGEWKINEMAKKRRKKRFSRVTTNDSVAISGHYDEPPWS